MSDQDNITFNLTEFAHGAGCGCKIAPQVLSEILASASEALADPKLIVGNQTNDDAAVYDLGNGTALISTTDFFMPIVDDAFDFGRIAAANAISDVYAMGGKPILALAILGWPVNKLPAHLAQKVLEGARAVCKEANITLAGGHSIDTLEPMFGLAVNGIIQTADLKKNNTAREGDLLYLTKPLGTGILSTAKKRKVLESGDEDQLLKNLCALNSIGEKLGKIKKVTAMTDVTGFGLLGHAMEMAKGSGFSVELYYSKIPQLKGLSKYLGKMIVPDATYRNWNAYSNEVQMDEKVNAAEAFMVLPDPQTNGGILFSGDPSAASEIEELLKKEGFPDFLQPIGKVVKKQEKIIRILS